MEFPFSFLSAAHSFTIYGSLFSTTGVVKPVFVPKGVQNGPFVGRLWLENIALGWASPMMNKMFQNLFIDA